MSPLRNPEAIEAQQAAAEVNDEQAAAEVEAEGAGNHLPLIDGRKKIKRTFPPRSIKPQQVPKQLANSIYKRFNMRF